MDIQILDSKFDPSKYNPKAVHPLQSWEWGEARKQMGIEVVRIAECNRNVPIDVYQMTLHRIPKTPFKIGYLPRSRMPSKAVVEFLTDWAKKHNVVFIKIEPNEEYNEDLSSQLSALSSIQKSPHSLYPNWTQVLDLSPSEDELLANMKQKTRYNTKLAQKKGVTVKELSNDEGFAAFRKLYFETTKRQGYWGHNAEYHEIIWNALKKNIAHILIAYYEGTPLAAYELFYFNGVFYYPYGGTSDEHRNLMAANLIMWEAIRLGKKLGAEKFDMWGSLSPENQEGDPSWAGFTRFKEGYGTKYVRMIGSYDLVINPTVYKLYNILQPMRELYLRIISKIKH